MALTLPFDAGSVVDGNPLTWSFTAAGVTLTTSTSDRPPVFSDVLDGNVQDGSVVDGGTA